PAKGLHLRAQEHEARLDDVRDRVVVPGLPVGRDEALRPVADVRATAAEGARRGGVSRGHAAILRPPVLFPPARRRRRLWAAVALLLAGTAAGCARDPSRRAGSAGDAWE